MSRDVVVVGAGLAGLVAALRLADAGRSVTLVAHGMGGLPLSQGSVDILGYAPERVFKPLDAVASVASDHPYASLGADAVATAVSWFRDLVGADLLVGDPAVNLHLPTAVGALRPTALAQPSMVAADAARVGAYAVVGVRQLKDFQADLIAGNLARSASPDARRLSASVAWVDLPARVGEADPSGVTYARALDDAAFAARFAAVVREAAGDGEVVLLPAVLGLRRPAWRQIQDIVGRRVAEVAMQPPSVPGMRLNTALLAQVKRAGVRVIQGSRVVGATASNGQIQALSLAVAGGVRTLEAADYLFAPGGFESGAIEVDSYGRISEPVFDLPLTASDAAGLISDTYWAPQRLFEVGVRVDASGRPTDADGRPVFDNLYAAGGIIAGPEPWRDKSGEGRAIATAVRAADSIVGGAA